MRGATIKVQARFCSTHYSFLSLQGCAALCLMFLFEYLCGVFDHDWIIELFSYLLAGSPKPTWKRQESSFRRWLSFPLRLSGSMLLFSGVYIVVASRYFFLFGDITSLTTSVYIILAESHIILEDLKKTERRWVKQQHIFYFPANEPCPDVPKSFCKWWV